MQTPKTAPGVLSPQLFDFRLEEVTWKAAPPYSVLLHLVGESGHRYFVIANPKLMRLYRDKAVTDHLVIEQESSNWEAFAAALLKAEFGR